MIFYIRGIFGLKSVMIAFPVPLNVFLARPFGVIKLIFFDKLIIFPTVSNVSVARDPACSPYLEKNKRRKRKRREAINTIKIKFCFSILVLNNFDRIVAQISSQDSGRLFESSIHSTKALNCTSSNGENATHLKVEINIKVFILMHKYNSFKHLKF